MSTDRCRGSHALSGGIVPRSAGSQYEAAGREGRADEKETQERLECERSSNRIVAWPDRHLTGEGVLREADESRPEIDGSNQEGP
jgi:hypothetical protein